MGLRFSKNIKKKLDNRGDTIVEVLIAIAIAGFAIGISYATAQRSLDQAISAREHNEALNILENQVTDLRVRFQAYANDPGTYQSTFAAAGLDYCLDDSAAKVGDPGWAPYGNFSGITTSGDTLSNDTATLGSSNTPTSSKPYYYVSTSPPHGCQQQRPGDGAIYYVNINTTNPNPSGVNSTLYYITVRWARLGGGVSRASLSYKLNYDPLPALGTQNGANAALNGDSQFGILPGGGGGSLPSYSYGGTFQNTSQNPSSEVAGCVWDWGDGTTTTNQACLQGDQIKHHFVYLPYSNYTAPDPLGIPPCIKTFTITLTVKLIDGSTWTSNPPQTLNKPSGSAVKGLPNCGS